MRTWLELTWTELNQLDRSRCVALLPVGAIEAHGPHLPLGTDGVIARAMARQAALKLELQGWLSLVLPTLDFTVAGFAGNFPGTLGFRPETVTAILRDLTEGLAGQGFAALGLANAHLDPGHLGSLHQGLQNSPLPVAFPDLTRRRHAQRLGREFQSGACHAGCFESSIVLSEEPELVRLEIARSLPENPRSLVSAIQAGQQTFEEAGGPQAYFGAPALASAHEGLETASILGDILAEAVLELLA